MLPSKARDTDKSTCSPDSSLFPKSVSFNGKPWPSWFRVQVTGPYKMEQLGAVAYTDYGGYFIYS